MQPGEDAAQTVTLDDIRDAERRLAGVVIRTPLLENPDVNARLGGRLLIKAECAQRTGAFKARGACNMIFQLSAVELARGVVTYSSGNHALGVALAARLAGTSALIVAPADAPPAKLAAVRAAGAEIVAFDRAEADGETVAARLSAETGRTLTPPSGDPRALAGAGTVATEIHAQAAALGAVPDAVLTPCGGGGLTAATAVAMRALSPETGVYAVEPEGFDDTRRSLEAGRRLRNAAGGRTICDAIMTPTPGALTFPINRALLAGGLAVSDDDARAAMRLAYDGFHIVAEPGGAVAIAAVLAGKIDIAGRTIVAVVTGGNIDPARFCVLLGASEEG